MRWMIGNMGFQYMTLLWCLLLLHVSSLHANQLRDKDPQILDLPNNVNLGSLHQKMEPEELNRCISYVQQGKIRLAISELGSSNDEIIHKIVKGAYANDTINFNNVLKFSRDLPRIKDSAVAYKTLYNQMKLNNQLLTSEIFMLAYKINEHMNMIHYQELKQYYKNMFQEIKTSLPYIVRLLVWQKSAVCTIKNNVFEEYMYAGSWAHKDIFNGRRKVYTWTPGSIEDGARWNLTLALQGGGFTIQNTYYDNEYLMADDNGNVRTKASELVFNSSNWKIEPQDSNDLVKIKNDELYLGAYNYGIGILIYRRAVGVQNSTLWIESFADDTDVKQLDLWKLQCN